MENVSLKTVMTQGYLYVEEHESLGKVLGIMRDRRTSCLFVLNEDMPIGIITERKIVDQAVKGVDLLTASVKDVMSGPLISLRADQTVDDACKLMSKHEIRHIGIVDGNGRLKGSITANNIVNILSSDSFSSTIQIKDIMFTSIVLAKPEATLKQAGIEMLEKRSCCAIVMEAGRPIGLVSEKDAARALSFGQNINTILLGKIMSSPVITVHETDSVAEAIITLRTHHIHRAVVMNGQEQVVGTIALNNLVRNMDLVLNNQLRSFSF
jgi:CBS domain-containing protein